MPFLDALNAGWLLPLAATVRLEISDAGRQAAAGWELDGELVSPHGAFQAAGNPHEPRPVLKFHNPWTIRTPAGWSCLFVPPLNRPPAGIEVLAGIVDTDRYVAPVNLPFVALGEDGVHTLPKGTRSRTSSRSAGRRSTPSCARRPTPTPTPTRVTRNTRAEAGWYKRHARGAR